MGEVSATPGGVSPHMEKIFFHMKFASNQGGDGIFHMGIVKKYMNEG